MEEAIAACYTNESTQPSYLELQMSADFLSFLPESFRAFLEKLVNRFPVLQPVLDNWRLALAMALVFAEGLSLSRHSGTVSERFFGLRRSSTSASKSRMLVSLLEAAVLPCLSKDNWFADKYHKASAVYRVLFLLGLSRYFTPLQHLGGITFPSRIDGSAVGAASKMGRLLYAVQLLHWVQMNRNLLESRKPPCNYDTSPPPSENPRARKLVSGGMPLPLDPSICAICHRNRKNPTAVISGYVFCYVCIERWTREVGKHCPVTKVPVAELRRLY